jgi:hypothetical protein
MKALLRKDAPWLLGFAASGLVIHLLMLLDSFHAAELWMEPEDRFGPATLMVWWAAATLLGLCAGLIDEVFGARDYLVHRPVSPARLFWTRHLGGGLVLASWILLGPTLHLAVTRLIGEAGALVDRGRWWLYVRDGTPALVFYAAGVFSAALARRRVLALPLAALISVGVLALAVCGQFADEPWPVIAGGVVPLSIALAGLLLLLAFRLEREGRDRDRPASPIRLGATTVALLLASVGPLVAIYMTQGSALRDLLASYPVISRLDSGAPVLLGRHGNTFYWRVDDRHRPIEGATPHRVPDWDPYTLLYPPTRDEADLGRGHVFDGVRYWRIDCPRPMQCYLGSDGLVHLTGRRPGRPGFQPFARNLGKQGGARFSPRAQVLGHAFGGQAMLGDPDDGGVWTYDLARAEPAFTRVPVPTDDRFVTDQSIGRMGVVIAGTRGLYQWGDDGFLPAPSAWRHTQADSDRPPSLEPRVEPLGPFSFRVTVPDFSGTFSHLYAPYTLAEKMFVVYLAVPGLARPPLLSVLSLATAARPLARRGQEIQPAVLLDPMVSRGAGGLVILDLALAAGLIALTWRRLRRLGTGLRRQLFWATIVGLLGVIGYLACRLLETSRAWREVEQEPARPLLIRTVA